MFNKLDPDLYQRVSVYTVSFLRHFNRIIICHSRPTEESNIHDSLSLSFHAVKSVQLITFMMITIDVCCVFVYVITRVPFSLELSLTLFAKPRHLVTCRVYYYKKWEIFPSYLKLAD